MVLLDVLLTGLFALISDGLGTFCTAAPGPGGCQRTTFTVLSAANILDSPKLMVATSFISFGMVVILSVFLHYVRWDCRVVTESCDMGLLSASDYSLIVRDLPEGSTEASIRGMFEEWH
jgi:hypothetical protein